jgi:hypothetical protein
VSTAERFLPAEVFEKRLENFGPVKARAADNPAERFVFLLLSRWHAAS